MKICTQGGLTWEFDGAHVNRLPRRISTHHPLCPRMTLIGHRASLGDIAGATKYCGLMRDKALRLNNLRAYEPKAEAFDVRYDTG
jgi:hypothetical protein